MGLIDLKTNLTSLKYGSDRLGGGSSNQPYIQTPIPEGTSTLGALDNDFLLRGGSTGFTNAAQDVYRLTKMFGDLKSPNGALFVAKQELLSRVAVRTQTSGVLNEGIYTPLSTLAEAGVVGLGTHLNKQGINPFAGTGAYSVNSNLYGVKVKPTQDTADNRLYQLTKASWESKPVAYDGLKVILNNGINVMTYTGGPGSILGAGNTAIRYSPTSQTPLTKAPKLFNSSAATDPLGPNGWTYSSELLATQPDNELLLAERIQSPKIQDFRVKLREALKEADKVKADASGATILSLPYSGPGAKNIENRVHLGDPGQRAGKNYSSYSKGITYAPIEVKGQGSYNPGLDKITSLPIYRSQNVVADDIKNDLVKFRIAIIDNDNPGFKTFMHFRAFLGSISDSYNANWNPVQYLGRGEQFFTYGGFTRQISLSWTVAAQSKQELIPMYKKLNYLASSLAPDYSPKGYMRGNLAQLTIGGYIYELPGIITGLTYDIGEDTPWEVGIEGNGVGGQDGTVKELPHIIRVTGFNFTPIHKFIPGLQELGFTNTNIVNGVNNSTGFVKEGNDTVKGDYGDQRFISIANGVSDKYSNYNYYDTAPGEEQPLTITPNTPINSIILDNGISTVNV